MNFIKGIIPNIFLLLGSLILYVGSKLAGIGIALHKWLDTREGKSFIKAEKESIKLAKVLAEIKQQTQEEKLFNGPGGNA